jgi:DNA-binding GntR family transcriptional regulator
MIKASVIEQDAAMRRKRSSSPSTSSASDESRPTAVEIVQKIDEAIARGRLVAGQRLVEADLIADYGASRSVVREALRFLAGEGIVELTPNRGARIRRLDFARLLDMLEVFTVIMNGSIATLTAKPIDPKVAKLIKAALDRILRVVKHGSRIDRLRAAFDYHDVVCRNCGNSFFAEAIDRLHVWYYLRQMEAESLYAMNDNLAESYTEVTKAILRRDPEAARAILFPLADRLTEDARKLAKDRT